MKLALVRVLRLNAGLLNTSAPSLNPMKEGSNQTENDTVFIICIVGGLSTTYLLKEARVGRHSAFLSEVLIFAVLSLTK